MSTWGRKEKDNGKAVRKREQRGEHCMAIRNEEITDTSVMPGPRTGEASKGENHDAVSGRSCREQTRRVL